MIPNKPLFTSTRTARLLWIIGALIVLFMALSVSSCYSPKKATRQVLKAQTYHPEVVAKACADLFPIKETTVTKIVTKEGKTDTVANYVLVDCDSVVKSDGGKLRHQIRIPCPPSLTRVDTVEKDRLVIQENTARVSQLTTEKQNERDARIKAESGRGMWRMWCLILIGYCVVRIALRLWLKISLP